MEELSFVFNISNCLEITINKRVNYINYSLNKLKNTQFYITFIYSYINSFLVNDDQVLLACVQMLTRLVSDQLGLMNSSSFHSIL